MTQDEIKNSILKSVLFGNYENCVESTFDLHIFAKDISVDYTKCVI